MKRMLNELFVYYSVASQRDTNAASFEVLLLVASRTADSSHASISVIRSTLKLTGG
jgi:hypothetical protein